MMRVGVKFLIVVTFVTALSASAGAQKNVRDSLQRKFGVILCDTTTELADSILHALRSRDFASLKPYIPSAGFIKLTLDSLDTTSLAHVAQIHYNYRVNVLRKDYARMMKSAKRNRLNLKKLDYENRIIRIHPMPTGFDYAEIFLIFKKKDERYVVSFLAVEMLGFWFIQDQLYVEPLI